MPLSPRFEELMDGLELKDALWHLQRANAGMNHATEEELKEGYFRILQLSQNTGGCVTQILEETTHKIGSIPALEAMIENRGALIREGWTEHKDESIHMSYQKVIGEIAEYVRLSKLQRQAQKLQKREGVQIRDVTASIQLLPDKIQKGRRLLKLNKARILAILPQEVAAA